MVLVVPVTVMVEVGPVPEPMTTEFVPEPVQNGVAGAQVKTPCVWKDRLKTSSPLGRKVNGSAVAVEAHRPRRSRLQTITTIALYPDMEESPFPVVRA